MPASPPPIAPDGEPSSVVALEVTDAAGQLIDCYHLLGDGDYILGRDRETAHLLIDDKSVSRRHALVRRRNGSMRIADAGSLNGTILGTHRRAPEHATGEATGGNWLDWPVGETVTVGLFKLGWRCLPDASADGADSAAASGTAATASGITPTAIGPERCGGEGAGQGAGQGAGSPKEQTGAGAAACGDPARRARPDGLGTLFGAGEVISLAALQEMAAAAAAPVEERDYLSIGGGFGSLAFVDRLRVAGVAAAQVRVLGIDADPSAKWADYCAHSQIPPHERIRSNSASTPDNLWGFPGFALREAWQRLRAGRPDAPMPLLQVFGEPLFWQTYTPTLGQLRAAVTRECRRIGWADMVVPGRAIALRKTDDGRYAVSYRVPLDAGNAADGGRDRLCIARHVHVATGYPATRILPLLQAFRRKWPDDRAVVNAYEPHDEIYRRLEASGGTVVVEGRGIVASRILQRLAEAHGRNVRVDIVHVMRHPLARGHAYDLARRPVAGDVELQPFNWPKAAWGGTLRRRLEAADSDERARLLDLWGGTSTADRRDWRQWLNAARREGWYRTAFGDLVALRRVDGQLALTLRPPGGAAAITLAADHMIDCTGLVADISASPFLLDLADTYALPRNRAAGTGPERGLSGIAVSSSFEIRALRNGAGRVHASGIITAGGLYAAVDSFLGLTFAAHRAVESLRREAAPGLRRLGPVRSLMQWLRWCRGVAP